MKKYLSLISVVLFMSTAMSQATIANNDPVNDDEFIGWDGTSTIPLEIRTDGTGGDAKEIQFFTNGVERASIGTDGTFKAMRTVWYDGSTGSTPTSGIGTRMMWIPDLGAFRAGRVTGDDWDATNIGSHSWAGGLRNKAKGNYSFCMGVDNEALNEACICLGDGNFADGHDSFAAGEYSYADGLVSVALGYFVKAEASNNSNGRISIGSGILGSQNYMVNSIDNSLAVGFDSTVPTFIVTGGDGTAVSYGHVGIAKAIPAARLDVKFDNSGETNADTFGTRIIVDGALGGITNENTGLKVEMDTGVNPSDDTGYNRGIYVESSGGKRSYGIEAVTSPTSESLSNRAIHGIATGDGSTNLGNYGAYAKGQDGYTAYGIYCQGIDGSNANYGIYASASGTGATNWAGYFNGNVYSTGTVTWASDETLKENIQDLEVGIEEIMLLQPKSYNFQCDEYEDLNLDDGNHCGLLAQDVQVIFPDLVHNVKHTPLDEIGDPNGEEYESLSIAYIELFPIIISGMQDQQEMLADKQASIEALEAQLAEVDSQLEEIYLALAECCQVSGNNSSSSGDTDNDIAIILPEEQAEEEPTRSHIDQNFPNPFSHVTTINYSLACDCYASIKIYSSAGKLISILFDENQLSGQHSIQWEAKDLVEGIYFYSLEVDGIEMIRRAVRIK